MDEIIRKELEQEKPTPFHEALLAHCIGLVDLSRNKMGEYYDNWDRHDETYRGITVQDKQDRAARDRKEPEKMVVPLTYSQVQTFIAFAFSLYYQRQHLFELSGVSPEDEVAAKIGEALIDRDLAASVFDSKLYQFLLDTSRFGLGVLKCGFVREMQEVEETTVMPPKVILGVPVGKERTVTRRVQVPKYVGNRVYNISPYRFYPDVRLPLGRFQEGEFCASEDEVSVSSLYQMQVEGQVAGINYIQPMTKSLSDQDNRKRRLVHTTIVDTAKMTSREPMTSGMVILTECQVKIIPSKFTVDGKPLGKKDYPELWNVWFVNDQRIVKAEPLGYVHNQFTYTLSEYSPDLHNLLNDGLAGSIDALQSVITWFINSHITSVRKTIQNWLVVDPKGINMQDIVNRSPVIRMKDGVGATGVERWVKQLQVVDVTARHVEDAEYLHRLVQVVSGINENALGQFHTGRRSATEARAVNVSAAARLKMIAQIIFKTGLEPLARQMLSNLRQGLDVETYVKVMGDKVDPMAYELFKKVTKADLVGDYDFEVFDGTLPTERYAQAGALKELLVALMSNPEAIQYLGYDPRMILREVLELEGIKNPQRFFLQPGSMPMQAMPNGGGTANGNVSGAPAVGPTANAGGVPPFNLLQLAPGNVGGAAAGGG